MPRKKTDGVDYELLGQLTELEDSPEPHEGENAFRRIREICRSAGVRITDAYRRLYEKASPDLEAELEAKADEIERLHADNKTLKAGVADASREIQQLTNKYEKAKAELAMAKQGDEFHGEGFSGFVSAAWSMGWIRTVIVTGVLALRIFISKSFAPSAQVTMAINWLTLALLVLLFVQWSGREFENNGLAPTLVKSVVLVGSMMASMVMLFGSEWKEWFRFGIAVPDAGEAYLVLAGSTLVTISSAAKRLVVLAATSEARLFSVLRAVFS